DTSTTYLYTLSLHDALPIWFPILHRFHHTYLHHQLLLRWAQYKEQTDDGLHPVHRQPRQDHYHLLVHDLHQDRILPYHTSSCLRSEEHTSELQSRENLVCRL